MKTQQKIKKPIMRQYKMWRSSIDENEFNYLLRVQKANTPGYPSVTGSIIDGKESTYVLLNDGGIAGMVKDKGEFKRGYRYTKEEVDNAGTLNIIKDIQADPTNTGKNTFEKPSEEKSSRTFLATPSSSK